MIQRYDVGDEPKMGLEVTDVIHGGMGIVYILQFKRDPSIKKVLKSCDSERIMGEPGFSHMHRESLIWLSLLPHPNIVKADSFEVDGGVPFLLMEYVGGGNLRQRLNGQPADIAEFLRIALEFCEGMTFLAANEVVHRDIKPENILFTDEGRVKITDFGIAMAFQNQGASSDLSTSETEATTDAGMPVGTVPYMAPEQFEAGRRIDTRTDIYAFGVVMYEMLAGRLPFEKDSIEAMTQAHRHDSPPPLPADAPEALTAIVMKCLAKKPSDRYEDFRLLSRHLTDFCLDNGLDSSIAEHHSIEGLEEKLDAWDWNNRGYAISQLGNDDEAVNCYRRGLEKASLEKDEGNFVIVEGVDKKTSSSKSIIANLQTNMGSAYLRLGKIESARASFNSALEAVPDHGFAYLRLGQLALNEGNVAEGMALLKKSCDCEPGNRDILMKYLRVCHQIGDHDAFEAGFQEFLEAKTGDAPFLVAMGCFLDEELGPDVALRCFDEALKGDEDNLGAWYNKGVTLHRMGREKDAMTCYEHALRLDRTHTFARFYMGLLMTMQGKQDEAIFHLKKFLENSEESPLQGFAALALQGNEMGLNLRELVRPFTIPQAIKHVC